MSQIPPTKHRKYFLKQKGVAQMKYCMSSSKCTNTKCEKHWDDEKRWKKGDQLFEFQSTMVCKGFKEPQNQED